MEKKKLYIQKANSFLAIFRCYIELLRLAYNKEVLKDDYISTAKKIQKFLEEAYRSIIKEYTTKIKKGEKDAITIIIDAIGVYAFNELWFIEGLKEYYKKKEGKMPLIKPAQDFTKLFERMQKVEKKMKKSSYLSIGERTHKVSAFSSIDGEPSMIKTHYYRDLPLKMEILYIHYVYGLLRPDLHEQILKDCPLIDTTKLNELISSINKILPE